MSNEININGIEITATFSAGSVTLAFAKDGKVIKTCHASDAPRFVRPENLAKVVALVEMVKESDEANAYWASKKMEADAYEAEYQERTGNYEARHAMMLKTMSVQG